MDLSNLIAYWPLDEPSTGTVVINRADAYAGHTLTDGGNKTPSDTGLVYAQAALFVSGGANDVLSRSSEADFQVSGTSWTVCAWVYLTATGLNMNLVAKGGNTFPNREWLLWYDNSASRFLVTYCEASGAVGLHSRQATTLGAPSLNTWYFVVGWYDDAADTLNIQVNNGTVDSTGSLTVGAYAGTSTLEVGDWNANARIGPALFWKRVLSATERTNLYNGGAGLTLAQMMPVPSVAGRSRPFPFRPGASRTRGWR
jgi:hypothetical protein